MKGVIVVPAVATNSRTYDGVVCTCGATIDFPTFPQLGCARIAAIGYAKNGIVITTKMRSASLYVPRTSSTQTATAATGTDACGGTCASPSAAPMPTNSEMQMPRFATRTLAVANSDQRTP